MEFQILNANLRKKTFCNKNGTLQFEITMSITISKARQFGHRKYLAQLIEVLAVNRSRVVVDSRCEVFKRSLRPTSDDSNLE